MERETEARKAKDVDSVSGKGIEPRGEESLPPRSMACQPIHNHNCPSLERRMSASRHKNFGDAEGRDKTAIGKGVESAGTISSQNAKRLLGER